MKKLIFFGLGICVFGGVTLYYGLNQDESQAVIEDNIVRVETTNKYLEKFNKAKTSEELQKLLVNIKDLPKFLQGEVINGAKLRLAIFNFQEAEGLLNRARYLQSALSIPDKLKQHPAMQHRDSRPVSPPKIVPQAMVLLEKALPLYEDSKIEVDKLSDIRGYDKYNFTLNYVKGEVYHRYLQLFATEETAPELLAQTVTYYKSALKYNPGDIDTVVNIELLIKDSEGTGGGGRAQQRQRLLNQAPGRGNSKGN